MNCCEQTGTGAGCNQGPDCPVRASRAASAGEAYPLPIVPNVLDLETGLSRAEHVGLWIAIMFLCLLLVFLLSGGELQAWKGWAA